MRKFNTGGLDNFEVDLDDESIYSHLSDNPEVLRNLMFQEIGYVYCYMDFWYSDVFDKRDGGQRERVIKLIKNFTDNEKNYRGDRFWLKEQIFIFRCEIENMC